MRFFARRLLNCAYSQRFVCGCVFVPRLCHRALVGSLVHPVRRKCALIYANNAFCIMIGTPALYSFSPAPLVVIEKWRYINGSQCDTHICLRNYSSMLPLAAVSHNILYFIETRNGRELWFFNDLDFHQFCYKSRAFKII